MGERKWQPGDVALIEIGCQANRHVAYFTGRWGWSYGEHWVEHDPAIVTVIRPLVVIDPESREQMDDLSDALVRVGVGKVMPGWDLVRAALREFANPTPPKPPEPTGRWSRVLDDKGREWCRTEWDDGLNKPWQHEAIHAHWQTVDAVRVLSEGVQPVGEAS